MRAVSPRRARENRIRAKVLAGMRDLPCQVRWDATCTGRMQTAHEPLMRSRGGDPSDREAMVPTCNRCHEQIHANPKEATERGWMKHAWGD